VKTAILLAGLLAPACLFPVCGRADEQEDQAIAAIKKAGGGVAKSDKRDTIKFEMDPATGAIFVKENQNDSGKYHILYCSKHTDVDAVMIQIKHLKHLDTVRFWDDPYAVPGTAVCKPADKHMETLAAVAGLKELRLMLTTDPAMKHLGTLKNLEKMNLHALGVSGAGLKHLANLTGLKELRIGGIADTDLEHLSPLLKLKKLSIYGKTVTGGGLKHLAGLKDLETLDLRATAVAGAGLGDLAGLKALRVLLLTYTNITDEDCKVLANYQQLTQLDLGFTRITDAGIKHLTGLNKLEKLYLSGTHLSDAGLTELAKGCKGLRQLAITETKASLASRNEFRSLRPEVKVLDEFGSKGLKKGH
jgi:hypothetical protein